LVVTGSKENFNVHVPIGAQICNARNFRWILASANRDQSKEALRQVEQITDSKPVRGETLLRHGAEAAHYFLRRLRK
jgi:hypothetical protein